MPIAGKSLTHLHSSSMECRRKTTHPSQSKTTYKTRNQGSYVGQEHFLGCYFICTVGFSVFYVFNAWGDKDIVRELWLV